MKYPSIKDVLFYNLPTIIESDGSLVPIESNSTIPFAVKRVFYVYGVNENDIRGEHAHYKTKQLLICLNGIIDVKCSDGINEKMYRLDSPQKGLLVPNMIWDEQYYKSKDAILLVLTNTKYDQSDYIYNFNEFKKIIKG